MIKRQLNNAKTYHAFNYGGLWSLAVYAAIPQWAVEPRYRAIHRYAPGIYKGKKSNGKVVLFKNDDKKILKDPTSFTSSFDSITPIRGGYGLLLNFDRDNDVKAWRIMGVFDASKESVRLFDSNYRFYMDAYPFFSESLMPVFNEKHRFGYINLQGLPTTRFDYIMAYPFNEGLGAVIKAKRAWPGVKNIFNGKIHADKLDDCFHVNASGMEFHPDKELGKKIILASTFKNDRAVIVNKDGEAHIINKKMEKVGNIEPASVMLDDMHALLDDTPPLVYLQPDSLPDPRTDGLTILGSEGLYGFMDGEHELVPLQFNAVDDFDDSQAVVTNSFGTGIIKIVDEDLSFNHSSSRDEKTNEIKHVVQYNIPESLRKNAAKLLFSLTDSEGNSVKYRNDAAKQQLLWSGNQDMVVIRITDAFGLVIYEDDLLSQHTDEKKTNKSTKTKEKKLIQLPDLSIAIGPGIVTANAQRQASVQITVKNNSKETKSFTLSASGQGFSGVNVNVSLAPGKSRSVYGTLSNIIRTEKRTITVSAGNRRTSRTISVKPKAIKL